MLLFISSSKPSCAKDVLVKTQELQARTETEEPRPAQHQAETSAGEDPPLDIPGEVQLSGLRPVLNSAAQEASLQAELRSAAAITGLQDALTINDKEAAADIKVCMTHVFTPWIFLELC